MTPEQIQRLADALGADIEVVGRFCDACGFVLTDRGELHRSPVAREYPCEECLCGPGVER